MSPEISLAPIRESIGERIRRCRKLRGWTQGELAQRTGLQQWTISQIECGTRDGWRMQVETAWRIAFGLGIGMDVLIGIPDFAQDRK